MVHPSCVFDPEYYLAMNPDARKRRMDPYYHYRIFGEKKGYWPNAFFDPVYYAENNSDAVKSGICLFTHYQKSGHVENRLPSSLQTNSSRILFIGHDASLTGAPKVLLETIKYFFQQKTFHITVILLNGGDIIDSYRQVCHDFYILRDIQKIHFRDIMKYNYRFIFLNTVVAGKFIRVLHLHHLPVPKNIVTYIHELREILEFFGDAMTHLLPVTKHWITVSEKCRHVLTTFYSIPQDEISVIYPYIDLSMIGAIPNIDLRTQLGIHDPDSLVIMNCGTVQYRKGFDLFIKTARNILIHKKSLYFVWIGSIEPEAMQHLTSMTPAEKERIRFVGKKLNARDYFMISDLFFLTSREDPHPLVVLEAASVCVPTICFGPGTGITEFIRDDAGICLPSFDCDLACQEILKLIADHQQRKILGRIAQERVMARYDTSNQMKLIMSTISKYISPLEEE